MVAEYIVMGRLRFEDSKYLFQGAVHGRNLKLAVCHNKPHLKAKSAEPNRADHKLKITAAAS
jgi:hypothetical protein